MGGQPSGARADEAVSGTVEEPLPGSARQAQLSLFAAALAEGVTELGPLPAGEGTRGTLALLERLGRRVERVRREVVRVHGHARPFEAPQEPVEGLPVPRLGPRQQVEGRLQTGAVIAHGVGTQGCRSRAQDTR